MKTADLEAEYQSALTNLKNEDAKELVDEYLIPFFLVFIYQMVGILPIRLDRSGSVWEPDSEGVLAYITPARVERPDTVLVPEPWEAARCGELVDLVAWDPRDPLKWATRCGHIWLGSAPLNEPFPTLIRRSPLSWLKHDCDGLVPLSREPVDIRYVLGQCEHGLHAEDQRHLDELRLALRQPAVPFEITVRSSRVGGGPRPDHRPDSWRRRQAERHWGNGRMQGD